MSAAGVPLLGVVLNGSYSFLASQILALPYGTSYGGVLPYDTSLVEPNAVASNAWDGDDANGALGLVCGLFVAAEAGAFAEGDDPLIDVVPLRWVEVARPVAVGNDVECGVRVLDIVRFHDAVELDNPQLKSTVEKFNSGLRTAFTPHDPDAPGRADALKLRRLHPRHPFLVAVQQLDVPGYVNRLVLSKKDLATRRGEEYERWRQMRREIDEAAGRAQKTVVADEKKVNKRFKNSFEMPSELAIHVIDVLADGVSLQSTKRHRDRIVLPRGSDIVLRVAARATSKASAAFAVRGHGSVSCKQQGCFAIKRANLRYDVQCVSPSDGRGAIEVSLVDPAAPDVAIGRVVVPTYSAWTKLLLNVSPIKVAVIVIAVGAFFQISSMIPRPDWAPWDAGWSEPAASTLGLVLTVIGIPWVTLELVRRST